MTFIGSTLLFLAGAAATPSAPKVDAAGNRWEALQLAKPSGDTAPDQGCAVDGSLCAEIVADDGQSVLHVYTPKSGKTDLRYDLSESGGSEDGDGDYALSPDFIRLAKGGGALVGVTWSQHTMYSGGGGASSELRLILMEPGAKPKMVLALPVSGAIDIRACFSEKDMRQRAGACSDEYTFSGDLALDPAVAAGPPRLIYTALATSYPGHVSRSEDSLSAPPLHKKDLARVTDPRCSYRRIFTWQASSRDYQPDRPLPDCGDYTVP